MKHPRALINKILQVVEKRNIIKSINKVQPFNDDPKLHIFSANLNSPTRYSDGIFYEADSHGLSFYSKEQALLVCLLEALERFSNSCYRESSLLYSSYESLSFPALSPNAFFKKNDIEKKVIGWVKGVDLIKGTPCYIPAQTAYLTYDVDKEGIGLTETNTNGSAGGFNQSKTILKALYEVIERDGLMSMFYAQIPVPRIDVGSIPDQNIHFMYQSARRYGLELMLFDITTDVGVPSYMGALVDRTGLGPCISIGAKTSMNQSEAVTGALLESFLTRTWIRREMLTNPESVGSIDPKQINNLRTRGLYWAPVQMLSHLNFLLSQEPISQQIVSIKLSPELALVKLIALLDQKNIPAYAVDVSWQTFKKNLGYCVYKAVIPKLQPLFLFEKNKKFNDERLKDVAAYYNMPTFIKPKIPAPFL